MKTVSEPSITPCDRDSKDFTKVTFIPDFKLFKLPGLDDDHIALMTKRVYDIAGSTADDLKVSLNGTPLKIKSFREYCDLYPGMGEEVNSKASFHVVNDRWSI